MQFIEVQKHTEYLFNAALKKCKNISDAEDLTQEVLLAALQTSVEVLNVKSWLSSVLNHKYYDMLRRKYRLPTISIDFIPDESEFFCEEVENQYDFVLVRREVSYLADKYRTVIVRHYLNGERVQDIADSLGVPKGQSCQGFQAAENKCGKDLKRWSYMKNTAISPKNWKSAATVNRGFMVNHGHL